MKRSMKECCSSSGSMSRWATEMSCCSGVTVFSMELTCFLRRLSKNFVATVMAIITTTNKTRKTRRNGASMCPPSGNFHNCLEDRSRQLHAGSAEALVEFGPDTGCAESSGHSAGLGEAGFFEHKDVL